MFGNIHLGGPQPAFPADLGRGVQELHGGTKALVDVLQP